MAKGNGKDVRALRGLVHLNQTDFWTPIGVTQSGGSRYEGGRRIPRPVQLLLRIRYGIPKTANTTVQRLRAWRKW